MRLTAALRRFAGAHEGVAAVEFALILPIMLAMYLGSIELSQAFNVDERVINIAGTIGDLTARSKNTISNTVLTDYFKAATAIMSPFSTSSLKQVVTMVSVSNTGVTKIEWSKGYNGATTYTTNAVFTGAGGNHPIPTEMLAISHNSWVIVSEASYSYTPLLGMFFTTPFQLYHQSFYAPRYAADITFDASS